MRWLIPALCFFGGAMFGMLIMALMVANSRAERNEEVMTDPLKGTNWKVWSGALMLRK